MPDAGLSSVVVRFDVFEVDLRACELRKEGRLVKLQEQPFHVLTALLLHPGKVVTREDRKRRLAGKHASAGW